MLSAIAMPELSWRVPLLSLAGFNVQCILQSASQDWGVAEMFAQQYDDTGVAH